MSYYVLYLDVAAPMIDAFVVWHLISDRLQFRLSAQIPVSDYVSLEVVTGARLDSMPRLAVVAGQEGALRTLFTVSN